MKIPEGVVVSQSMGHVRYTWCQECAVGECLLYLEKEGTEKDRTEKMCSHEPQSVLK